MERQRVLFVVLMLACSHFAMAQSASPEPYARHSSVNDAAPPEPYDPPDLELTEAVQLSAAPEPILPAAPEPEGVAPQKTILHIHGAPLSVEEQQNLITIISISFDRSAEIVQ